MGETLALPLASSNLVVLKLDRFLLIFGVIEVVCGVFFGCGVCCACCVCVCVCAVSDADASIPNSYFFFPRLRLLRRRWPPLCGFCGLWGVQLSATLVIASRLYRLKKSLAALAALGNQLLQ